MTPSSMDLRLTLWLWRERRKREFTQLEFAALIGVSENTYGPWERGVRRVALANIARIADALTLAEAAKAELFQAWQHDQEQWVLCAERQRRLKPEPTTPPAATPVTCHPLNPLFELLADSDARLADVQVPSEASRKRTRPQPAPARPPVLRSLRPATRPTRITPKPGYRRRPKSERMVRMLWHVLWTPPASPSLELI